MKNSFGSQRRLLAIFLFSSFVLAASCHRAKAPATTRYPFTGRVISIDSKAQTARIDGDLVQGYMAPMAMAYKFKPASQLRQLAPGDAIAGELVVVDHDPRDETTEPDYWLENVKITGHAKSVPAAGPNALHLPEPGEDVPDFTFTNQDGKKISIRQYRGKVLLVTFIYTRCPFQDFCPRMSANFSEIYQQIKANPALKGTHLLSVTFDPEHDTPKVLRDYGFSVAHTHEANLFRGWEFAVPAAVDLPKIEGFFALTVQPDGGMITHNLSTTVIGPDGKVARWYHGGDWQVSDLIKDAAYAHAPKA